MMISTQSTVVQQMQEPLFLTTKEVMTRYRISSSATLWKWRRNDGFPAPIHNGRHYLKASLDKWDEKQQVAA
ncbi:MAG: helix-turn-helix domain-containing protein [Gammaproteobacteria bacterium]|uniref:Helix-turn-helix domain-containing protein n=1 Tax=Shewanella scandinavica TaxID=3063538 RepID=A0ABU3G2L1_9GAMM|nr:MULTISPECIES: helix-turn-helix domain-containing protein [unclassified Shewanella]EGT3625631.1 helix-turn-helix domain-containing protein [Morganella morganii]MBU1392746.1 helix-turn-helix domain-containing protein [Gammaproteobacteria bacterium]MBU1478928.1 helix-turn-helix domain-containing protein [Gammaproteobacteria bacterium]MBU2002189.1 helix-turn-helix domain-containing protein [Gammaproteobacteria bacterium]MBU2131724.1 helix-turn-helix domain-containing protein [Gammaproteobacteri